MVGVPSGFLTSAIQARVERDTGYRLTIAGATKIGLWPSLNVTLNDVTLQDPKDRDGTNRLTVGQRRGRHDAGEPVVGPARRSPNSSIDQPGACMCRCCANASRRSRRRQAAASPADAGDAHHRPRHVTDGTVVFSNLRDRVENRIEGINADATIGADRKLKRHRQRPRRRAAAQIRHQGDRAGAAAGAAEHSGRAHRSMRPACCRQPLSAKAEVRLNGSIVMINGLSGTLGDGAFNGWASVDIASKPLVKLDLDFQRLDVATRRGRAAVRRRRRGATPPSTSAA